MATWKNLDTLASYSKLAELKGHVNIADAMAGEKGAERVKKYSTPMAAGLTYNYAAKQVDETVLDALAKLADEAELIDKFQELYNGAVINTGEKRMVLHHLARTQLGEDVVVDGAGIRRIKTCLFICGMSSTRSYFCQFLQSGYFHTPSLIVTQMQMQYIHLIE